MQLKASCERSIERNKRKGPTPYIITGRGLDGSVASLLTLWLLNTLDPVKFDPAKFKLLCITFGSPLLGDNDFQQAISRHLTWNSCFLHVVYGGDCVPRLYLDPPPAGQNPYKPFGTFLLCSKSGGACFQAHESIIELLKYENLEAVAENQESQTIYNEKLIECIEKMHFRRNDSHFRSDGLYLAKLAVSSNILTDSWNAVSKHQGDEPVTIIRDHPEYNFIVFVGSPVTASDLQQENHLISASENSDLQFLCSDTDLSSSINPTAFSLFDSLHDKLSQLQEEVKTSSELETSSSSANKKKKPIPYIITGRGLNGSVASLFTLWLLNTLDLTKFKLRCITFGSPLLGDAAFQQAVSSHPTWNSCFLHVVHKGDYVPRLTPVPPYKPFGTFLLCLESGDEYLEDPESLIERLIDENPEAVAENQKSQTFDYKYDLERVEKKLLERDYEAGITVQVVAAGHQQDGDISALIKSITKHEHDIIKPQGDEFDPAQELNELKVYLALMEWYMKKCRANGEGPGYYDSFKNARERRDNGVDKYKTYLTKYWENVVEDAKKKPQLPGEPLRKRWLFAGTNYRRIVEPLDIAEYYRRGRKDYKKRGRSNHYELLEQWLKEYHKKKPQELAVHPKSKEEKLTEDSCFWAQVEEAIRSCRRLDRDRAGEEAKLKQFEEYVKKLIDEGTLSPDVFLEKSSYMQWWREYEEILKKDEGDSDSQPSGLVDYMKKELYKNYGKERPTDSNANPPDSSHLVPTTS
ncbi:hypothetical protein BT93_E1603 [Corymbia citriodora subsp. variegata]|nr:hypothetical protein BT93_E1603 [Corymbia citriodora subsp. variegata]